MKFRKTVSLLLVTAIFAGTFVFPSVAAVTSADYTAEELECSSYDVRKYTEPFWEGNIVYNEIVHPIRDENGNLPQFQLMYDATEIVSVKDYKLQITYREGVDYTLVDGNLCILPGGSIYIMDYEDMHPSSVPADYGEDEFYPYYPHADNSGSYEYWTGGSDVCSRSLAVTYIHNDTWKAPIPESQESRLPNTFNKLKNDEDITIVVAGDSVSTGAMASGFLGISPYAEAYPEMTVRALRAKYSNDGINLINSAIGGTMSDFDATKMQNTIIQYSPDLVILNFGMNDSSCGRVGISGQLFHDNLAKQINYIKNHLPGCEVLLVSSLYGNRYTFSAEKYEEHAAVLHTLAEEFTGVGVADPQAIEKYLIEVTGKDYICFTADNMVHPGDLGMRLSAQSIIEALSFEDISPYRTFLMDKFISFADVDNRSESKKQEILDLISETENTVSALDEEWDINEVIDKAYETLNDIIARCDVHTYIDTVIAPMCKAGGYTHSVCSVCGYSYDHDEVPMLGGEHIMDSGRYTVAPTYKTKGVITYSCTKCDYSESEELPILTNPPTVSNKGMLHFDNDHNYMASDIQPYTGGAGYVEFDFCPLNIERYDGTPYVGLWFSKYSITACYNFAAQEVQIIQTSLPFGGGTVHASVPYSWTSNGGKYEYNWKKFAVHLQGNTVRIYIDGSLVLEDTKSVYSATTEVALLYSNGECYMDNIKVLKGNYNPVTGEGGTSLGSWDFNTASSFTDFKNVWGQQYAAMTRVTANAANITTGMYSHTHSGSLFTVIDPGCAHGGFSQYVCDMCGEVYMDDYTDPTAGSGHSLINRTVTVVPTSFTAGKCTYECENCDMTFTEILPKGTQIDDGNNKDILGDVDGNGVINNLDYSILLRFVSGGSVEITAENADMDSNGSVNNLDLALLVRELR